MGIADDVIDDGRIGSGEKEPRLVGRRLTHGDGATPVRTTGDVPRGTGGGGRIGSQAGTPHGIVEQCQSAREGIGIGICEEPCVRNIVGDGDGDRPGRAIVHQAVDLRRKIRHREGRGPIRRCLVGYGRGADAG